MAQVFIPKFRKPILDRTNNPTISVSEYNPKLSKTTKRLETLFEIHT